MSDTQRYIVIGVPILAWLAKMVQINRVAGRMDRHIEKLSDRTDRQIENLSGKIEQQIEQLSGKIARLAEQQHKDALILQGYMFPLHERMALLENRNRFGPTLVCSHP